MAISVLVLGEILDERRIRVCVEYACCAEKPSG